MSIINTSGVTNQSLTAEQWDAVRLQLLRLLDLSFLHVKYYLKQIAKTQNDAFCLQSHNSSSMQHMLITNTSLQTVPSTVTIVWHSAAVIFCCCGTRCLQCLNANIMSLIHWSQQRRFCHFLCSDWQHSVCIYGIYHHNSTAELVIFNPEK